MTKAKNQKPQEQPAAAPASAPETQGQAQTSEQPKEGDAQENAPDAEQPAADTEEEQEDPRALEVRRALRSFPTLPEGYLTAKGVYFDKAIAEQSLEEGEELIIVSREK